jgi:putative ABC transport system permease protein
VAWGILILLVLLGAGEGLQAGIMKLFGSYAQNSLWFYAGKTSEIQAGQAEGKNIYFDNELMSQLTTVFPEIEALSPEYLSGSLLVSHAHGSSRTQVYGVYPSYFAIKLLQAKKGRVLNAHDQLKMRKVAVIGSKLAEELFDSEDEPGQFIEVNGTLFKVVGVLESGNMFTQSYQSALFITMPVFQECMNTNPQFTAFGLTLAPEVNTRNFKDKIVSYLARRLGFSVSDKRALFVSDMEEQVKSFNKLFAGIKVFLWLLGASLLTTGVVGISNIMFIVVKERTREIGIRKAIGATPQSILGLILIESITVTLVAGLVGMGLGVGIIQLINSFIQSSADGEQALVSSININFTIAVIALVTIVLAGCLAGLFPARNAADVKPVEAINQE